MYIREELTFVYLLMFPKLLELSLAHTSCSPLVEWIHEEHIKIQWERQPDVGLSIIKWHVILETLLQISFTVRYSRYYFYMSFQMLLTENCHWWLIQLRSGLQVWHNEESESSFLGQKQTSLLGKGARSSPLSSRSFKGPSIPLT